jgi:large conductance mechanosensitive channel
MLQEFKTFISRGNVIDLAVGLIMGAAFTSIVTSLVNDILMPPIGMLIGGLDFSDLYINLSHTPYSSLKAAKDAGAPTINYGAFLNAILHFLIVSVAVFLLIKQINRFHRQEAKHPTPTTTEKLLEEIRDLLKTKSSPGKK